MQQTTSQQPVITTTSTSSPSKTEDAKDAEAKTGWNLHGDRYNDCYPVVEVPSQTPYRMRQGRKALRLMGILPR